MVLARVIHSRFKKSTFASKIQRFWQQHLHVCAEAYSCTDISIPSSATNEMGKTCADFNSDPNFKSGIFSGSR